MKSNYMEYNYLKSFGRIETIISESDNSFEELDSIPSRDKLSLTNGFYVNCSALFVDIRGSSQLPEKHNRPKLAKLYRAYISEVVAVMNGDSQCAEVNIVGDCVSGIFDTPLKKHIDSVFSTAAIVASLVKGLNCKFRKYGIEQISVGIGASWGRALMIKAGYSGSSINDVVWMGQVVNEASKLCSYGKLSWQDKQIMVSSDFYGNLNEDNKKLLVWSSPRGCYHGDVVNSNMEKWYQENCTE